MKVTAHVLVHKGYGIAIEASQWRDTLEQKSEEYNQGRFAPGFIDDTEHDATYLGHDKVAAVVTVEFEVPDDVFVRQPTTIVAGTIKETNDR